MDADNTNHHDCMRLSMASCNKINVRVRVILLLSLMIIGISLELLEWTPIVNTLFTQINISGNERHEGITHGTDMEEREGPTSKIVIETNEYTVIKYYQ